MKKNLIIILIVVLVVAAGAVYYFTRPVDTSKQYYYSTGDAFVTNVLDSDKLIKTTVVLGLSQDIGNDLNEKSAKVRDCVLYVLRNQTVEQYQKGDLQDQLSDAIVGRLNEVFPPKEGEAPLFVKAYFSDFVMQ
ncbi:MAG: flagellar basal body-associated FliL family protein [Candidatus Pelethousia sp.]|nr:flagellar basal body-associated FliL family protein [Candidatus Pelethousia sp.]